MSSKSNNKLNCELNCAVIQQTYEIKIGSTEKIIVDIPFSISTPKRNFFGGIFHRQPTQQVRMKIIDLQAPSLLFREEASLIEIVKDSETGSDIKFDIRSNVEEFKLQINKGAILDFEKNFAAIKESESNITISFKLKIEDEKNGKCKESEEIHLNVKLLPSDYKLTTELFIENNPIDYSPAVEEPINVGYLLITHTGVKESCPEFDANLQVKVEDGNNHINELVTLDITNIEEEHQVAGVGDVISKNQKNTALVAECQKNEYQKIEYQLSHIKPHRDMHIIKIPVMFDMRKIRNPRNNSQIYTVTIEGELMHSVFGAPLQRSAVSCRNGEIVINQNKRLNELLVECDGEELMNGGTYDWKKRTLVPGFTHSLTLKILNSAETIDTNCENARVVVKNFRQNLTAVGDCLDRICHITGLSPQEFIRFKDNEAEIDGPYNLFPKERDDQGYSHVFNLDLIADEIKEIKRTEDGRFSIKLKLDIEFDYEIDQTRDGDIKEGSKKHFKGSIVWNMEQQPNPGWLSIDFGTSAIVASYSETLGKEQDSLLDIHSYKEAMIKRINHPVSDYAEDNTEPSPFIPSTIGFNSNNEGDFDEVKEDAKFDKYPILLSPTPKMQVITLPCLKTLVGYKTIPNVFTDVELEKVSFNYGVDGKRYPLYSKKPNFAPKLVEPKGERGLIYVNTILEEVYKQLFRHIICFDTGGGNAENENPVIADNLHKLVLTVPNTFTSKHHEILKRIAKGFFPNLRPEYLQVVSESDAVACAYLYHRHEFFQVEDEELKNLANVQVENVLVYDMGAGTLDLTYFTRRKIEEKCEIEIKGKVGVNKAGNYLDYVLGEILAEFIEDENKKRKFKELLVTDRQQRIENATTKSDCEALKKYIKSTLKPLLNLPDEKIPPFFVKDKEEDIDENDELMSGEEEGKYTFGNATIQDILSSKGYQEYITECTYGVLNSLVALLNTTDCSGMNVLNGNTDNNFDVDVVVFSGRSTSLNDIRCSVAAYIKEKLSHKENVLYADFKNRRMFRLADIEKNNESENVNGESLKTVVTFGSLVYSDWVNRTNLYEFKRDHVFANYGFIYKLPHGNCYEWVPLITPASGIALNEGVRYEETVYFNMQNASEIIFVQSYSSDTAEDWSNGCKDMISEICRYRPDGGGTYQKISMKILHDDRVVCSIEEAGEVRQEPHDDFNNTTLRKSLWPVVF